VPFTEEQFFQVFSTYNIAVWPLPIAAYVLGLVALGLLFWRTRSATLLICGILALMWLVTGAGYHWSFFAEINPAARLFGAVFLFQALLLAIAPFLSRGFRIVPAKDAHTAAGLSLVTYALVVYPLLGRLAGHAYPAVPVFGIAPCPTTIFTIGLLLLGTWRTARWLLVIPALWGVVGGSAAVLLGVPQDYGLIAALLVAVGIAVARWSGARVARHEVAAP
jgi:hypothetical protein